MVQILAHTRDFIRWLTAPLQIQYHDASQPSIMLASAYIVYNRVNFGITSVAAVAILATFWGWVPEPILCGWVGCLLVLTALRARNLWIISRVGVTARAAERILRQASLWLTAAGLVWGASIAAFWWLDPQRQMIMTMTVAAVASGAWVILSPVQTAMRLFTICALTPYAVYYALAPGGVGLPFATFIVLLAGGMSLASRIVYRSLLSSYRSQETAQNANRRFLTAQNEWAELSGAAEAFALFDEEGGLLLWNDAYSTLLGLSRNALSRGMTAREIGAVAMVRNLPEMQILTDDREALESFAVTIAELQLGRSWLRSTVRRLSNGHVAVSHVDVTSLKLREAELLALQLDLEAARVGAEEASQAKSRFLANISHELRTPLNAVIGFSDLLVQDAERTGDKAEKQRDYARLILYSGHHLLSLVDDMLDLARIESGKVSVDLHAIDICELVKTASHIAMGRQIGTHRRIVLTGIETPHSVYADPRLLRQALINIVGNAIKFSDVDDPIEIAVSKSGPQIVVTIVDHGIGIPEDMLEEVLKPFAQVESSETRRYGGVGLGLPLAKQFLEMMGGTLTLSSTLQVGTTVTLAVPAAVLDAGAARRSA